MYFFLIVYKLPDDDDDDDVKILYFILYWTFSSVKHHSIYFIFFLGNENTFFFNEKKQTNINCKNAVGNCDVIFFLSCDSSLSPQFPPLPAKPLPSSSHTQTKVLKQLGMSDPPKYPGGEITIY